MFEKINRTYESNLRQRFQKQYGESRLKQNFKNTDQERNPNEKQRG
jgi:hypothetical protein